MSFIYVTLRHRIPHKKIAAFRWVIWTHIVPWPIRPTTANGISIECVFFFQYTVVSC